MPDTIAGVSTAVGNAGISIIRMSGDNAFNIADKVFKGKRSVHVQESHTLQYGKIVTAEGAEIDEVLLAKMAAPRTYTREDVIEINCHGGYLAAGRILSLLYSMGAVPAEPGEFTKRAFLNGRIDLSQAEAVMDVIQARTRKGSQAALRQLDGELSETLKNISGILVDALAGLEVNLDYPEYDDEAPSISDAVNAARKALDGLNSLIESFHYGKILRDGMNVVIVGKPNVGKSSLMNRLSRTERAIVTEIPGTTRDIIEETVNIGGVPIRLTDTAGVRETADVIESMGVERSLDALKKSDFALLMLDASDYRSSEDIKLFDLVREYQENYQIVFNKSDLVRDEEAFKKLSERYPGGISISVANNSGLDALEKKIVSFAEGNTLDADNQVLVTNARHERLLRSAAGALQSALDAAGNGMTLDIIALELKAALEELGRITGRTAGEDVINAIFSRFCIGK